MWRNYIYWFPTRWIFVPLHRSRLDRLGGSISAFLRDFGSIEPAGGSDKLDQTTTTTAVVVPAVVVSEVEGAVKQEEEVGGGKPEVAVVKIEPEPAIVPAPIVPESITVAAKA